MPCFTSQNSKVWGLTDARKMLLESGFSFTQRMNSVNTQAASNQSLYYRKANSSQGCWEEGEEPPLPIVLQGLLHLKDGGRTNVGSRKMFFPIGLAQLPRSVLVQ